MTVTATAKHAVRELAGAVLLLPLPLAALAGAFAGGGTWRWGRGRVEDLRAEAQEAKDAAAAAFYELDTAQRELLITVETITAADDSADAAGAAVAFRALGERIDQVSQEYIAAVDAHDLDSGTLDAAAASSPFPSQAVRARLAATTARPSTGIVRLRTRMVLSSR